jgi:hypothetical protein
MSFLGDALQPQPHPQPPPIRILVFTGRGTGGSSARRVKLIAEARGAQVQFGDVAAIVALSCETTDLLVLPGGSAVQQINAFGEIPSSRSFRGFFSHTRRLKVLTAAPRSSALLRVAVVASAFAPERR